VLSEDSVFVFDDEVQLGVSRILIYLSNLHTDRHSLLDHILSLITKYGTTPFIGRCRTKLAGVGSEGHISDDQLFIMIGVNGLHCPK
jgi:hypothetical protein